MTVNSEREIPKLNEYIFNSVSPYLIDEESSFNNILEYSLISKHWYKIFQNLLHSPDCKLILPFDSFLIYIINFNEKIISNNLNNENIIISFIKKITDFNNNSDNRIEEIYKLKLIQFKDIENIIVNHINNSKSTISERKKGKRKKINDRPSNINPGSYDIADTVRYIDETEEFQKNILFSKEFLHINCPNIKKVTVLQHQKARFEDFDYWCKDLFNFKRLELYYDCETFDDLGDDLGDDI